MNTKLKCEIRLTTTVRNMWGEVRRTCLLPKEINCINELLPLTECSQDSVFPIRSDERLALETSAFECLYGGQFRLSTKFSFRYSPLSHLVLYVTFWFQAVVPYCVELV